MKNWFVNWFLALESFCWLEDIIVNGRSWNVNEWTHPGSNCDVNIDHNHNSYIICAVLAASKHFTSAPKWILEGGKSIKIAVKSFSLAGSGGAGNVWNQHNSRVVRARWCFCVKREKEKIISTAPGELLMQQKKEKTGETHLYATESIPLPSSKLLICWNKGKREFNKLVEAQTCGKCFSKAEKYVEILHSMVLDQCVSSAWNHR